MSITVTPLWTSGANCATVHEYMALEMLRRENYRNGGGSHRCIGNFFEGGISLIELLIDTRVLVDSSESESSLVLAVRSKQLSDIIDGRS